MILQSEMRMDRESVRARGDDAGTMELQQLALALEQTL